MNLTQADYEKLQPLPNGAYWKLAVIASDPTFSDKCASPCVYIFTARGQDGSILPLQAIATFTKSGHRNVSAIRYHSALAPDRSFVSIHDAVNAGRWNGRRKQNTKHDEPVDILSIKL